MFDYDQAKRRARKEKRKVAVIGVGHGCGVSTVAVMFAYYLKKKENRVSLCEITDRLDKASLYYKNYFDKNMQHEELVDFYQGAEEGKPLHRMHNLYKDINWVIVLPNTKCMNTLTSEKKRHLINNVIGEYVICDVDFECEKGKDKILDEFDLVVALLDPLPSKVMENFDMVRRLKELEFKGYSVLWVWNFNNKGIHARDLARSLRLDSYEKIPFIEVERIYDCEYRCKDLILKREEKDCIYNIFAKGVAILDENF